MSTCTFCGQPSTLLCDGPRTDGKPGTCDKPVCRACAKKVSTVHVNRSRRAGGCYWDTIDLCPDCQKREEVRHAN